MNLFLYDSVADQVICVTSIMGDDTGYVGLVWSPDSAFISYATLSIDHIMDRRWFIVDLGDGSTYQVDENVLYVVGWSPEFIP